MKIKIVGFQVGESRPTANRTVDILAPEESGYPDEVIISIRNLGRAVYDVLAKSDFISIRRVDD